VGIVVGGIAEIFYGSSLLFDIVGGGVGDSWIKILSRKLRSSLVMFYGYVRPSCDTIHTYIWAYLIVVLYMHTRIVHYTTLVIYVHRHTEH
jgi:hypothetical protein